MTLHQPWHDGVGRRVGKRLRHIRKPRKPPDPKDCNNKTQSKTQRSREKSTNRGRAAAEGDHHGAGAPPLPPDRKVEIMFHLLSRHAPGRFICGSRRTICNSTHQYSRKVDREWHYRRCGSARFTHQKTFGKSSQHQKKDHIRLPIQLSHNLPTQRGPASIRPPVHYTAQSSSSINILAMVIGLNLLRRLTSTRKASQQTFKRQNPFRRFIINTCAVVLLCLSCISIGTRFIQTEHPWTSTINSPPQVHSLTAEGLSRDNRPVPERNLKVLYDGGRALSA